MFRLQMFRHDHSSNKVFVSTAKISVQIFQSQSFQPGNFGCECFGPDVSVTEFSVQPFRPWNFWSRCFGLGVFGRNVSVVLVSAWMFRPPKFQLGQFEVLTDISLTEFSNETFRSRRYKRFKKKKKHELYLIAHRSLHYICLFITGPLA